VIAGGVILAIRITRPFVFAPADEGKAPLMPTSTA
jgi:hypothetical protein